MRFSVHFRVCNISVHNNNIDNDNSDNDNNNTIILIIISSFDTAPFPYITWSKAHYIHCQWIDVGILMVMIYTYLSRCVSSCPLKIATL